MEIRTWTLTKSKLFEPNNTLQVKLEWVAPDVSGKNYMPMEIFRTLERLKDLGFAVSES